MGLHPLRRQLFRKRNTLAVIRNYIAGSFLTHRGIIVVVFFLSAVGIPPAEAQSLVFQEDFSYSSGAPLDSNGWTVHTAGTPTINVSSIGLSYAGYIGSNVGLAASLPAVTGETVRKNLSSGQTSNVYISFLVNVNTATAAGGYFIVTRYNTSNHQRGRVWIKSDGTGGFKFGVSKSSTLTPIYTTASYALNTTYLVVFKYAFLGTTGSASTDDEMSLWVNPASFGGSEDPDPVIVNANDGGADLTSLGSIMLLQGIGGTGLTIDGIRAATDWATLLPVVALKNTYYIDAVNGNDVNTGRSSSLPWQTLTNVNSFTFQPGDSILFRSGDAWTGQLKPKGSGTSSAPIVIGQYGGTMKPRIDGNGVTGEATVHLNNQEYWEIGDLEITNDAATPGDRRGVLIAAANFGTVHHIHLKRLTIHHVKGIVGDDDAAKRTAAIGIETADDASLATRFDDILIDGCTIYSVENTGIYTDNLSVRNDYPLSSAWHARKFTNVTIRNNTIHHISKNAMICRLFENGLVEKNVCYETALGTTGNTMFTAACSGTVFQYNEGYFNRSTGADGSMYDADLRSPNCIFQYSYSHDNAHGLFWSCTVQQDSGIIVRYNISQNDKGNIFCINYPVTSISCYNNTVYIGAGLSPTIISERNVQTGTRSYSFINNIIYNTSTTAGYDFRTSGYTRTIDHNIFFGQHPSDEPADSHKLTSDPMLAAPGSGGTGLSSIDGYKTLSGSPARNSGTPVANNGGSDLWNNILPSDSTIDRGAYENTQPRQRYESELFPAYQLQSDIQYGQSIKESGSVQNLMLDLYTAPGDTASHRAMVIFIHGGGFKSGDKVSNFGTLICSGLAKRGYVVASINYRLTATTATDSQHFVAMIRAVQDAKAAVRFFRRYADAYGIDSTRIYVTGSSAGCITALHMAYLDEGELPSYVDLATVGGSLEGVSGNQGYSSAVNAVVSNWGAIGDTAWIKPGDVPLYLVHGIDDVTVYYEQLPADGPFVYGSKHISAAAVRNGLITGLRTFANTGHTLDNNTVKQDSAYKDLSAWLFASVITGAPLPAVLTSFTAVPSIHGVVLHWRTATEQKNYGFSVERRNPSSSWNVIAFMPGSGTSDIPHDYTFTDGNISTGKYLYRLKQIGTDGSIALHSPVEIDWTGIPNRFTLSQNHPNPFNPSTSISYSVPSSGPVRLAVYDILGKEIALLENGIKASGRYSVEFDARRYSSGVYFYTLTYGHRTHSRKMLLLK
jgi:poly(3-hydroxybutyrate) depolymerase